MFFDSNTTLKRRVEEGRKRLQTRLENIRAALSRDDLDDTLREELRKKERDIVAHLEDQIKKMNGGP